MSKGKYTQFVTTVLIAVLSGLFGGAASFQFLSSTQKGLMSSLVSQEMSGTYQSPQGSEEEAAIATAKKSSPSVVSIIISKDLSKIYQKTGTNMFPFDNFFDSGFPFEFRAAPNGTTPDANSKKNGGTDKKDQKPQKQKIGGGSGFIISPDGLILTNRHVVSDTEAEYTVATNDGKEYPAKVLAKDSVNDVALIKIDAKNLPALTLGDSDSIVIGQTVIAIGNSLGEYNNTVTRGVISGVNRIVQAHDGAGSSEVIQEAIQTDTAINPGNSGGPLFNLRGEVIGINTAINQSGQSIGFAIPINIAKRSVESVKKFGRIIRPWIGVRYNLIDEEFVKKNKLSVDHGAIIVGDAQQKLLGIIPGGPADKAGLLEGDIILQVNGKDINQGHALAQAITKFNPGDTVTLKVLSHGKTKEVKLKLEEFKEQK